MSARLASVLPWVAVWAAGVALAILCRPALPVDETPLMTHPFRTKAVTVWDLETVRTHPGVI